VKTAYIAFEIIDGIAHVEQPVRSSDGVETWEVLPAQGGSRSQGAMAGTGRGDRT
jgi:hypothetical protein